MHVCASVRERAHAVCMLTCAYCVYVYVNVCVCVLVVCARAYMRCVVIISPETAVVHIYSHVYT